MSTAIIIVIVIAVVLVGIAIASLVRRRAVEREIERRRLTEEAGAHRDQAESRLTAAKEGGRESEIHRAQAEEHAARAEEHAAVASEHAEKVSKLDEQVQDAGHSAALHEREAAERESKLS